MSTQTMSEQIALLKNIIANLRGQVEEADATLERIRTALEEESGAAKQETDFTRLRYESGKHPYTGHPAARSSMPELYYLLLLTVLTSTEATEAQWLHLPCRCGRGVCGGRARPSPCRARHHGCEDH